jgi:hypothetical protein
MVVSPTLLCNESCIGQLVCRLEPHRKGVQFFVVLACHQGDDAAIDAAAEKSAYWDICHHTSAVPLVQHVFADPLSTRS